MSIPEVKLNYKIQYRIAGYDQVFEAGPHSESEVEYQRADIAGYEGVREVCAVPVHAE